MSGRRKPICCSGSPMARAWALTVQYRDVTETVFPLAPYARLICAWCAKTRISLVQFLQRINIPSPAREEQGKLMAHRMGGGIKRSTCYSYRTSSNSVFISFLVPAFQVPAASSCCLGAAILSHRYKVFSTPCGLPPLASCFPSSENMLLSLVHCCFPSNSLFLCGFISF